MKNLSKMIVLLMATAIIGQYTYAGPGFELGVRSGITATQAPIKSKNGGSEITYATDGRGIGVLSGPYFRLKFLAGWFTQLELNYAYHVMKNKYELNVFGNTVTDKTNLNWGGVYVPLLVGKSFLKDIFRIYAGPNLMYVLHSNLKTDDGTTKENYNLLKDNTDKGFETRLNPTQIGLEFGIGTTIPIIGVGADIRYGAPLITGFFQDANSKAMPGIITITLNYRFFNLGL